MTLLAALAWVFAGLVTLAVFGMYVTHEVRKGPGKRKNIRVPRETLWGRTNRYHGDRS